ncbi:MAG: YfcE family phosphodiesterase [Candidatus Moranbacteria bacterium]|nr:YfcE family phosphodiesterase [Candidatus Moranbacteria bacterium]
MHIAIISDIHDNIPNLEKVLDYCRKEKIGKMICCGDLMTVETLGHLNENFSGEIFFALGNADQRHFPEELFKNHAYGKTKVLESFGEEEFDGKRVAFVHFPEAARELAETGKYDFVFHGHTHKPWEEMIGNCKVLNPGNVANQHYPPTFAIWNTKNDLFKLVRLNSLK